MPRGHNSLGRLPVGLSVAVVWLGATNVAVVFDTPRLFQVVVAFGLLLFGAGYPFVCLFFPVSPTTSMETFHRPAVRVLLAPVVGTAKTSIVGVALALSPVGYSARTVAASLTVGGVFAIAVAVLVRGHAPPDTWRVSGFFEAARAGAERSLPSKTFQDTLATGILLVAVVLAVTSVSYAAVTTQNGEQFTEFGVLGVGENGTVAGSSPETVEVGESESVRLQLGNYEGREITYTVVVRLQDRDSGTVAVVGQSRHTVRDRETRTVAQSFTPDFAGEKLQLVFELYRGDSGGEPYRTVYLRIDVARA